MPPSREDQHEQIVNERAEQPFDVDQYLKEKEEERRQKDINGWYAANDGICPTCKRDLKLLKPEVNIYPHYMAMCNTPEAYVEKYNRKTPLIMRIVAIPFTIGGNILNWWRSR